MIPQGLAPITLVPNTYVDVTGNPATGLQVTGGTITQADASKILRESEIAPAVKEEANQKQTAQAQTEQAAHLAAGAAEALTGVAASVDTARQELRPKLIAPPKLSPGGEPPQQD